MIDFDSARCKFLLEKDDILTGPNFNDYIRMHGPDRAAGFIDAARHVSVLLEEILGNLAKDGGTVFSTSIIKSNTNLLYQHLNNFLLEHPAKSNHQRENTLDL